MRGLAFTTLMFIMAFCALLVAGINLYQKIDWSLHGKPALLILNQKNKNERGVMGAYVILPTKIAYEDKEFPQAPTSFPKDIADRLEAGDLISIYFINSESPHYIYSKDELESPWD